eukprot:972634_1
MYFTALGGSHHEFEETESGVAILGKPLECLPLDDLKELVMCGIKNFEKEFRPLQLVVFTDVLDRLAHASRVISSRGGALMCAGASGVGRRSAVTLLGYMHGAQLFTPHVGRGFGVNQFEV